MAKQEPQETSIPAMTSDKTDAKILQTLTTPVLFVEGELPALPFFEKMAFPVGPTVAQHQWLQKNPIYQRASHFYGTMSGLGTLHEDGTFVPEGKHPVMDGPGCFSVGIPVRR